MDTITSTLQAIKKFYWEYAPYYKNLTFDPCTETDIKTFETKTGFPLHPELKEFLTTCDFRLDLEGSYSYEGPKRIISNWEGTANQIKEGTFDGWMERMIKNGFDNWKSQQVGPHYCSTHWIAIARDGCGNEVSIDHAPGPKGTHGQILHMEFQDGQGPYYNSSSLLPYLQHQYQCLTNFQWTTWDYAEVGNKLIEIDGYLKPQDGTRKE